MEKEQRQLRTLGGAATLQEKGEEKLVPWKDEKKGTAGVLFVFYGVLLVFYWCFIGVLLGFYWGFMVFYWCFIVFYWGFMVFYWCFIGFYGVL